MNASANLLPTRKQLQDWLRTQGRDPAQLNHMSFSQQVKLVKEYQQSLCCS